VVAWLLGKWEVGSGPDSYRDWKAANELVLQTRTEVPNPDYELGLNFTIFGSFMKGDTKFKIEFIAYILLGNVLVHLFNVVDFSFDPIIYWLPEYALKNNFLSNLWHLHTTPPLLNFIYGLVANCGISFYGFCSVLYPALQIITTLTFYNLLQAKKIKHAKLVTILLFANPLHFIWFNFFYYPAILFFLSTIILSLLFSDRSNEKKLLLITIVFVIMSMIRASYHPIWILLLLLSFYKRVNTSALLITLSLLLIPLTWYTKNYFQYGFWSGSSLFGQNISAHYPDHLRTEIDNFNSQGRYKAISRYNGLYNENDALITKYRDNQLLNDTNTLQNVRSIMIARGYQKETTSHFNLKYSLTTIAYGTFSYFGSPAIDEYNNKSEKALTWNDTFLFDWFDLPNIKIPASNGGYSTIRLSWYTLAYPLVILYLLFNYRKLSFEVKFLLHWMIITALIYCTIDPNEAARMRYETEVVYFFILIAVWQKRCFDDQLKDME
jgi:hypothetical protein